MRGIDHLPAVDAAQGLQKGYGAVVRGYQRGVVDRIADEMHGAIAEYEVRTPWVAAPVGRTSFPYRIGLSNRSRRRGQREITVESVVTRSDRLTAYPKQRPYGTLKAERPTI